MKWFVLENNEILGPYKSDHVQETFGEDVLVWGPSLNEWLSKNDWLSNLGLAATQLNLAQDEPASESFSQQATQVYEVQNEATAIQDFSHEETKIEDVKTKIDINPSSPAKKDNIKWFYTVNKQRRGPLDESQLIEALSILDLESQKVHLWKKGLKEWALLDSFPEILDKVFALEKDQAA